MTMTPLAEHPDHRTPQLIFRSLLFFQLPVLHQMIPITLQTLPLVKVDQIFKIMDIIRPLIGCTCTGIRIFEFAVALCTHPETPFTVKRSPAIIDRIFIMPGLDMQALYSFLFSHRRHLFLDQRQRFPVVAGFGGKGQFDFAMMFLYDSGNFLQ